MLRQISLKQVSLANTAFGLLALLFVLAIAPAKVMAEKVAINTSSTDGHGCRVQVSGILDTATNNMIGITTFSGPIPCRNGQTSFELVKPNTAAPDTRSYQLSGRFDTDNLIELRSIKWSGRDESAVAMLSERSLNQGLVEEIRRAAEKTGSIQTEPSGPTVTTTNVVVRWGRKFKFCHGAGLCIFSPDPGPGCPFDDAARQIPDDSKVEGVATIERNRIDFELTTAPPERSDKITIDEDIRIDECRARSLGYKSLTILKGTYKVSFRGSKFGRMILATKGEPLNGRTR